MADIGTRLVDSADSAVMKAITRYVLTPAIIVLCGVSTMYLRGLADKVDGAAAKADVERTAAVVKADADRARTELWSAIGITNRAQTDLATSVAVLKSQVDDQRQTYAADAASTRTTLRDIQERLQRR